MKKILFKIFKILGFRVISNPKNESIQKEINILKKENEKFRFLFENTNYQAQLYKYLSSSKSQICQDWFVIDTLNLKRGGFFVEIGAASGVSLSNSFLLEKEFDWKGILVEPAKSCKESLLQNRKCDVDFRCVSDRSNEIIEFYETKEQEFSTIGKYSTLDKHAKNRKSYIKYDVKSVTLEKLLIEYNSPKEIDYLSIDTEGSEYSILKDFNFDNFSIAVITVEHNNTKNRDLIDKLLTSNNYKKVLEEFSQFESWFIRNDLI